MKLPLVLVCSLTAAAIACAGNASAAQKSSSAYSTSQNRTVYDSRAADRAEAYESFALAPGASALAPGASGVSSFGQVNSCDTIRPWKDETFNSAEPSWRCR